MFARSTNGITNWKVDFENLEGSEISPSCKLARKLATVSWMLTEAMRLPEPDSKANAHSKTSSSSISTFALVPPAPVPQGDAAGPGCTADIVGRDIGEEC